MTDAEIGEYTGCTHGEGGKRLFGCIPCAIDWHTQRQVEAAECAEYHAGILKRLGDEQVSRKLAFAGVEIHESAAVAPDEAVLVSVGRVVGRITGLDKP